MTAAINPTDNPDLYMRMATSAVIAPALVMPLSGATPSDIADTRARVRALTESYIEGCRMMLAELNGNLPSRIEYQDYLHDIELNADCIDEQF